jgi:hypothetical protein
MPWPSLTDILNGQNRSPIALVSFRWPVWVSLKICLIGEASRQIDIDQSRMSGAYYFTGPFDADLADELPDGAPVFTAKRSR